MVIYEWSTVASAVSNSERKNPKHSHEMYVRAFQTHMLKYKDQNMLKESQVEG